MNIWNLQRPFVRFTSNFKDLWQDLIDDVSSAFREVFWRFPRHLWRFCIKLIQYAPLLYRDEDYDYHFLLELMKFKIRRMRQHMAEHNIILNTNTYCKQMQRAEELIDLITKNEWAEKECEAHDQKWGKSQMETIPVPGKMYSEGRFLRLNVRTQLDKEQERKEFRKIMNLEAQRCKAAWRKLFKELHDNLHYWWD